MTEGGVGPPIPSGPDDGWGVSPDPSVSVIRPRIGPLWTRLPLFDVYYESLKRELKTKTVHEFRCDERLKN